MTMSKETQQVNNRLTDAENSLARIEAKLDALMKSNMKADEIKAVRLPEPKKTEKISSGAPYPIKENVPTSTTEVPPSPAADEFVATSRTPELEHKDTVPAPVVEVEQGVPTANYDSLTEGEAIKLAKDSDPDLRKRILDYERTHKNRTRVIEAAAG